MSVAILHSLAEITAGQWGMLTTAQAARAGVSRLELSRGVDRGTLVRLAHGVYMNTGTPGGRFDELKAAWLSTDARRFIDERLAELNSEAVVSGQSAAALHEIGDLRVDRHEFTVPARRQSQRPEIHYSRHALSSQDITLVEGLPATTPERTIADLVGSRTDLSLVGDVLRDATHKYTLDRTRLVELLGPHAAHYGFRKSAGEDLLAHLLAIAGMTPEMLIGSLAQRLMIVTPERLAQLSDAQRARVQELAREMVATIKAGDRDS